MKIYTYHLWFGCFYTPLPQKNIKNVIFSWFFRFFAYGLIRIFTLFTQIIYHKKIRKSIPEKNTKKWKKKVFKILFYFSKMDKNKFPNLFLKKKFQKTRIFCFFLSLITKIIILSPKNAILVLKTKKLFFGGIFCFFFNDLIFY